MAVSPAHRPAARRRDRHHTITFRSPAEPESSGWPRSVRALVAFAAVTPLVAASAYLVDQFSRNFADAYCSDSVDPACPTGDGFPVTGVGVLCALVFVGCVGTALAILVRRRLARRRHRGASSL